MANFFYRSKRTRTKNCSTATRHGRGKISYQLRTFHLPLSSTPSSQICSSIVNDHIKIMKAMIIVHLGDGKTADGCPTTVDDELSHRSFFEND